jgi:TetR/AcrR family transcriptional regulator, tetracycline repressor protein
VATPRRADANAQPPPPPPWARTPQRPPRRRRDPLTQDTIVDAALEVLDADGLDQLSMRHVARTLNTTAGALYWHVGSKDGLLDLILDRVIGHRDVVRLSIGRIPMGPHALRYADRVLAILRAGGLSDALAVAGQQLLISIVIGFCIDETGEGGHPPAEQPPADTAATMVRDYLAGLPADRFPNLVDLAGHHADADGDARFELLLAIFVDGLAQRAAS